ncbi:histidine decarboxylase-like [Pollicipes pollicipes]|uniref:histidine decarboxylase-like n=1 Tax=Pollicipes pollicipes TaxID=41117 RepID=UPI0018859517|nr:histidine decarboxylase-like isoform X1 [Pollicipes pollicipes]XP_037069114.1 histidine decarboxylase-like [Pollicipes pollicipes]
MDYAEYRTKGKEMVDYIADYLEGIRDRRVFPDVKPGYMCDLVPPQAPNRGEPWADVMADVERVIMPGVTHWQSPYMHAYFPALTSPPSMLGDMLANAMGCLGFTWASSPACTELEMIVMDWLGQMIGLPDEFLHSSKDSHGGGVIQTTASEATFVCLLAGRTEAISRYKKTCPDLDDAEINSRLVAYCSDQAHSSVEKAGLIGLVKMRYIETDHQLSLRGDKLVEAIRRDRQKGLIPFFLCATLGTTGACAFDNLSELGPICREEEIWMHVDAAYAGTAFICPEFRHWLVGVEFADSLAFNPSKWMMVHFDCTAMWVKNSQTLHRTFNVDPLYLQHENSGYAIDFMHWQIPLSKRFRALKLWFVLRSYGVEGLQAHVREGVRLANKFELFVQSDPRFEVAATRHLGLICFRLRGDNQLTERLLKRLNSGGKIHCVPASLKGKYVIRFTVTSTHTRLDDLTRDWNVVKDTASEVLAESRAPVQQQHKKIMLAETRRNPDFGTSLLLANSPMSPKIVDGSYVAIFDNKDLLGDFAKKLAHFRTDLVRNSPALRRRVRGMIMSGKQFSLDSRMDIVSTMASNADGDTNGEQDTSENGSQTPNKWKRSVSMVPAGPDDAGMAQLMVDDVIEEDDDESDDERYHQRIRETVARNACRKCGNIVWVK